jgi:hypothetical protein
MNFTGTVSGASETSVSWDVNGITGGNAAVGTIVAAPGNTQLAVYTAPGSKPATIR